MPVEVEDTFAEAFEGLYSEVLITAKNRRWLVKAVNSVTGCATSCIGCGCEAGVDRFLEPEETPDKRIGAAVQFWVASCVEDPAAQLESELINRIGQCVLTAPTTAVWNFTESEKRFGLGGKIGFFADGFQKEEQLFGRSIVNVPRMMGDFLIEKEVGYSPGVMGGNLWFLASYEDAALDAAEIAAEVIRATPGVITSFPGGVCAAGSKIGSKYKFLSASTNHLMCPSLAGVVEGSQVPSGVNSVAEVVFNGVSIEVLQEAAWNAIEAAKDTPGLLRISAGNYGGKLGRHRIYLLKR